METKRITMAILGLACGGGGALTVEQSLSRETGVLYVHVNPATEMAYVEYDPRRVDAGRLAAAVTRVGFRTAEVSYR